MRDAKQLAVLATMISAWCVCGCSSSDDSKSGNGTTEPVGGTGNAVGSNGGTGNTAAPNGGNGPSATGGKSGGGTATNPNTVGTNPGSGAGGTLNPSTGGKPGSSTGGKPGSSTGGKPSASGGTGPAMTAKGGSTSATGGAAPIAGGAPSSVNNPTKNPAVPGEESPTDDNGIFVSPDGNDSTGDGSLAKPYATIATALTKAPQGSSIILRNGTYAGGFTIRKKVTLRSRANEWAKIECSTDSAGPASAISIDVDADGTRLSRLEIVGGSLYAVMFQTKWDWGEADRTGATDVIIEDCLIHDTGRDGIKVTPGSDRATVRRTEIHHTGVRDNSNADGIDNVNGDSMHVYDSYFHDIATNGVYFKGGAMDCVIERTIVSKTGGGGIFLGFDTSPEYFDLEVNPDYYENINGTVKNCLVTDTQYSGIGLFGAKNPKVFNNTVINTAQAGHAAIYFGLTFQDEDESAGRPPTVNPTIYNNLVVQPKGRNCVGIRHSDEMGDMNGLSGPAVIDYNLYFGEGGACTFDDRRTGQTLTTTSLSEWAKHIGGESNSRSTDPLLNALYRPQAGSAADGTAKQLTDVATDLLSQARGVPPDIGAFELAK